MLIKILKNRSQLYLVGILFAALLVRLTDINYNTPFNDEAIYVVIGKMGIFENDYFTYNSKSWMAGLPYIYPVMTALAHHAAGIVGSRILNVIFGVLLIEEIFIFTRLLNLSGESSFNKMPGLWAAFIAAFSGVGIYTSRLATYDMPSYFFLFFALNEFLKGRSYASGKYFFISSIALITAFFTKIIVGVYLPFFFLISLFIYKKSSPIVKHYLKVYFYLPALVMLLAYVIFNHQGILTFMNNNVIRARSSYGEIGALIFLHTSFVLAMGAVSAVLLVLKGKLYPTITLVFLALLVPAVHMVIQRIPTLDKHLYLTVLFLAPLIGYGLDLLVNTGKIRYAAMPLIAIIFIFYITYNYRIQKELEQSWPDTTNLNNYLRAHVRPGDKVLTEMGASTILALYDKTYPTNITTFDWIDYEKDTSQEAYINALNDGYFTFVELNGGSENGEELRNKILRTSENGKYSLVYTEGSINVYEHTR